MARMRPIKEIMEQVMQEMSDEIDSMLCYVDPPEDEVHQLPQKLQDEIFCCHGCSQTKPKTLTKEDKCSGCTGVQFVDVAPNCMECKHVNLMGGFCTKGLEKPTKACFEEA